MSLRARLIMGLLALAALGLVVAGSVTYAEQRSFLQERVDRQARAALPAVSRALAIRGANVPGFDHESGFPGGAFGERRAIAPADRGAPPPGRGPDAADVNLPPGTYGQRRDADGKALGSVVLTYGQTAPAAPDLPRDMPAGRVITVGSVGGSGLDYRAVSAPSFDQPGTTVVAVPLSEVDRTLDRLLLVEALVIGGVLLALAAVSWLLVRIGLRPLDRIGETAGAIAAGDLSRRVSPATTRTEVGRLGISLNAMLERLEQAFAEREQSEARLRRFLANASHELRTPLASIRGYAELFRIGASANAADTRKAMRRIEEEAARMGVLVEDLLTLARLDEVRDAAREQVDLAALAGDATADARARDPLRQFTLESTGPALVSGDPHALRQVLGNLLGNAIVHTAPGTPVEVSVETRSEKVVLQVRDHGPGLPTDRGEVLFERFWRAERGRERGRAGAGLGLAIVAGIVASHGGTVRAENASGGGARFVVELPAETRALTANSQVSRSGGTPSRARIDDIDLPTTGGP